MIEPAEFERCYQRQTKILILPFLQIALVTITLIYGIPAHNLPTLEREKCLSTHLGAFPTFHLVV